jgi:hypothetical protein
MEGLLRQRRGTVRLTPPLLLAVAAATPSPVRDTGGGVFT